MTLPKISYIIPTLNRERTIAACLKSIADQTYSSKEIIIVDGGSRDKTLSIASEYASRITSDKGTLGQARETGIKMSSGEILGIFDSDIILPSRDWTEKAIKFFQKQKGVGIVWPINKPPDNSSLVARCYFSMWKVHLLKFLNANKAQLAIPGGNSLFLRKAVEEAGGFNTSLHFGEDLELSYRIMKLGYKVVILNESIIHDTMYSLKEYTKKQIWGATSLANADPSIVSICLNWSANELTARKPSMVENTLGYIVNNVKGMANGLAKEKDLSWLIFPILLTIRVMIYGRFLFLKKLLN